MPAHKYTAVDYIGVVVSFVAYSGRNHSYAWRAAMAHATREDYPG